MRTFWESPQGGTTSHCRRPATTTETSLYNDDEVEKTIAWAAVGAGWIVKRPFWPAVGTSLSPLLFPRFAASQTYYYNSSSRSYSCRLRGLCSSDSSIKGKIVWNPFLCWASNTGNTSRPVLEKVGGFKKLGASVVQTLWKAPKDGFVWPWTAMMFGVQKRHHCYNNNPAATWHHQRILFKKKISSS